MIRDGCRLVWIERPRVVRRRGALRSPKTMNSPTAPEKPAPEQLSIYRFTATVVATLAALLLALRLVAPTAWTEQFLAPAWKCAFAFLAFSLLNCFIEYFFHRYVLHIPAIP